MAIRTILILIVVTLRVPLTGAAEPPKGSALTMNAVLAASQPADWRPLDPENTLYLELAGGRVVIELAPEFAPRHVTNVKALAREGYYDGLAIVRAQDNYVVQWADPNAEKPDLARKIQRAQKTLPPEFDRPFDPPLPFTRLPDGDVYAPEVGFSGGFPVARDPRGGKMWLTHGYGMVGAGRDTAPDSGGGTELYVVIGQAPRHLDRNVTLLGRVVQGMELLSALPRGTGAMGFYEKPEQHVPIQRIRVAADVALAERSDLEVMRTDTPAFLDLIESRRNRREPWFQTPVGHIEIGNVPIPVRRAATPLHFKLHYLDRDPSWAYGVMQTTLADLNNDGKLDWTVGNCETDARHPLNLFWYEYRNPDHWVKHTIYGTSPGAPCTATVSLDVNHDGWRDLISGRYLFINHGGGTSWTKHEIGTATSADAVHDMFATDVNGDGRLDVLCANWYTARNIGIYWYEQPADPTQTWTEHFISRGIPSQGYVGIHAGIEPDSVGDFNGDGRADLACALGWIEKDNTAGTRWTEHWNTNVFLGVNGTYHVAVRTAVRDLNGDGYPDVIQAECDTATPVQIAWLKNDGRGNFTRRVIRQGYREDYHSLVVADLDGDGDLDVLTGAGPLASGSTGHGVFVFENIAGPGRDPEFVFHDLAEFLSPADAAALSAAFAADHEHDARFGDVDGDGRIDIVLKGYLAQRPAPFLYLENTTRVPEGKQGHH